MGTTNDALFSLFVRLSRWWRLNDRQRRRRRNHDLGLAPEILDRPADLHLRARQGLRYVARESRIEIFLLLLKNRGRELGFVGVLEADDHDLAARAPGSGLNNAFHDTFLVHRTVHRRL